jgi:hypothetical protein
LGRKKHTAKTAQQDEQQQHQTPQPGPILLFILIVWL